MVTINKIESEKITSDGGLILAEVSCLSTDEKPVTLNEEDKIANGSSLIEIDTGKLYLFDAENQEWKEI